MFDGTDGKNRTSSGMRPRDGISVDFSDIGTKQHTEQKPKTVVGDTVDDSNHYKQA
jgi:hypothetical protein